METAEIIKRIEKDDTCRMTVDEIKGWFGVPMISNSRMSAIRFGRNWDKITYPQNGTDLVLATLDSGIELMDFSPVTKTLCVGLESGHVGFFELELEDGGLDLVLMEEGAKQ